MTVNIGAELQALPLEYMLSAPLVGAIKSQALAAQTTVQFIEKVGLEEQPDGTLSVRQVKFEYSKQVSDPAQPDTLPTLETHELTVPMLAIIPVPYVRIQELDVEFEFKVKETITRTAKVEIASNLGGSNTTEANFKVGGGFASFFGAPSGSVKTTNTVNWNVSASYKSSTTQTQDRSARISFTLKAVQDEMPAGLKSVLTILNDAITSEKKE
jgi:hypothetical protein